MFGITCTCRLCSNYSESGSKYYQLFLKLIDDVMTVTGTLSGTLWPPGDAAALQDAVAGAQRLAVVGVLGRTPSAPDSACKGALVAGFLDEATVLGTKEVQGNVHGNVDHQGDFLKLHWYKKRDEDLLYVVLEGIDDHHVLVAACESALGAIRNEDPELAEMPRTGLHAHKNQGGLHNWLADVGQSHAKALLFMFHVCHLVIISHPVPTVDLSYVRLLRALQQTKESCKGAVAASLGPEHQWYPGSPSLTFLFHVPPTSACHALVAGPSSVSGHRQLLQESLEGQIRRIIRKARVTSLAGPSERFVGKNRMHDPRLFSLATRDFVHLHVHSEDGNDGRVFDTVRYLLERPDRHSLQAVPKNPQTLQSADYKVPLGSSCQKKNRNIH